ncbi:hypothetical protein FRB91_012019, partial [Serendipita sp. 411]
PSRACLAMPKRTNMPSKRGFAVPASYTCIQSAQAFSLELIARSEANHDLSHFRNLLNLCTIWSFNCLEWAKGSFGNAPDSVRK